MIVQTVREPREVLASVASLLATLRGAFSDRVDPHAIGREVLARWSRGAEQAHAARQDPAIGADRFFDVCYADLVCNPVRIIQRIYEYFELEFTATAERRMREYLLRFPRGHRPRHDYRLETFGIRPDEVDARFQPLRAALGRGGAERGRGRVVTVPDLTGRPMVPPVCQSA
jgi:hypothetical protein